MKNQKNSEVVSANVENTPVSPLEKALTEGDIDRAVYLLKFDPSAFRAFVKSTEVALIENKDKAYELKDKSWLKRLFTANSSELAKLVIEQNDVMARFFVMLQLLTLQNKNNLSTLMNLCSAIKKDVGTSGEEKGNLQRIAVTFLEQNIDAIRAEETRDRALIKLLKFAEQNAVFEKRITTAQQRAEQQYVTQVRQLSDTFGKRSKELDEQYQTFACDIQQKMKEQNELQQRLLNEFQDDQREKLNQLQNDLYERQRRAQELQDEQISGKASLGSLDTLYDKGKRIASILGAGVALSLILAIVALLI